MREPGTGVGAVSRSTVTVVDVAVRGEATLLGPDVRRGEPDQGASVAKVLIGCPASGCLKLLGEPEPVLAGPSCLSQE